MTLSEIKEMIESAPTRSMARDMLNTWRTFGTLTESQYKKGREMINKEFEKQPQHERSNNS